MAIKNKDGTPYTLTSPNPLMAEQEMWRKSVKFTLHNKLGTTVTLPDTGAAKVVPRQVVETPPLPDQKFDPQIVDSVVEPDPVGFAPEEVMQVWCLPGTYKEYQDPLYNESYRKITYGKKFLFEAVLADQNDLQIILWTNTKAVSNGSILFPRNYDKRWWRVEAIKQEDDGYLIYGTISDYQPEFSDPQ